MDEVATEVTETTETTETTEATEESNDSPFDEDYRDYTGDKEALDVEEEGAETEKTESEKHRVSWGDEEEHLTVDELRTAYQTRKASDKKFRTAVSIGKKAEAVLDRLKTDPINLIEAQGVNFRELAEDYLYNKLHIEDMSEEERGVHDDREALKRYREQEAQLTKIKEDELMEKTKGSLSAEIKEALKVSNVPSTPGSSRRVAQYMLSYTKAGKSITPEAAVALVRRDLISEHKDLYSKLDTEQLGEFLDQDTLKKAREFEISKLKRRPQSPEMSSPAKRVKKPKLTIQEWKKQNERFKLGLA